MNGVIVKQVVAEIFFELGQKARGYEGRGCGINAGFAL